MSLMAGPVCPSTKKVKDGLLNIPLLPYVKATVIRIINYGDLLFRVFHWDDDRVQSLVNWEVGVVSTSIIHLINASGTASARNFKTQY